MQGFERPFDTSSYRVPNNNSVLKHSVLISTGVEHNLYPSQMHFNCHESQIVSHSRKIQFIRQTKPQNIANFNNSWVINDQPVFKSMIHLEKNHHTSQTKSLSSQNHSVNKRKKYISVTQRQNPRSYHSQKKTNQKKLSFFEPTPKKNFQTETNPPSSKPNQSNSYIQQPFSIKDFLTPQKSFKKYLKSMFNGISRHRKQQNEKEQHILNEDDINLDGKMFQSAQKAKKQRNDMKSVLILREKQKHKEFRLYTQAYQQVSKPEHLTTEPYHPSDSRNFMVFEQKIGENTLTRKDSLILALMENLSYDHDKHEEYQQKHTHRTHQLQFVPLSLETPLKAKKSISLIEEANDIPLLLDKLKEKTQSAQEKQKNNSKSKSTKIKFISLMQKQQQHRYRNSINQNVLKDQFINLKKKSQLTKTQS